MTTAQVKQALPLIFKLRYQDGLTSPETAKRVGCNESTVAYYAPGRPGCVSNQLVREAFLASGHSAVEVALELGWTYRKGKTIYGDGSRLRRALGLYPVVKKSYEETERGSVDTSHHYCYRIDAEIVARIAEVIGLEPWEVGYFSDDPGRDPGRNPG